RVNRKDMRAEIYWIDGIPGGRLAVLPRPRGGDWLEEEVQSLRLAGVDLLVSLLTTEEIAELDLLEEATRCAAHGIDFISFPIADRDVPASGPETFGLVKALAARLAEGKTVAFHCRQGIGRSALLAACVLAALGDSVDTAFERIARARGCSVPETAEQRAWVRRFVDRYLANPGQSALR